jgi:hypothetical protein
LNSPLPLQVLVVHLCHCHCQDDEPILHPSVWKQLATLMANREALPDLSSFTLLIFDLEDAEVFSAAFKDLGEPKILGKRQFPLISSLSEKRFDNRPMQGWNGPLPKG